jgi:ribosomal protein S18 acetylase RimI-like enzyme
MTGDATVVRPAQQSDVPALVALMRAFYEESAYPLPEAQAAATFSRLIDAPQLGSVWVIESAGHAAGFVVLTVAFSMEYGGLRGFVDDLFVAPRFRRSGLAAAALDAVKRACVARGVRALLVETSASNAPALRVYRRAGFDDSGRLLMTLPLAPATHEAWPAS